VKGVPSVQHGNDGILLIVCGVVSLVLLNGVVGTFTGFGRRILKQLSCLGLGSPRIDCVTPRERGG
jgi:hypothetical protein